MTARRTRPVGPVIAQRTWSAAAAALGTLRACLTDPVGVITPAVYDTAHAARLPEPLRPLGGVEYLLEAQRRDGSWGPGEVPSTYRVVPTVAAVATLGDESITWSMPAAREAALRGLSYLVTSGCLADPAALPDTVAVETIVPAELEQVTHHLDTHTIDPAPDIRMLFEQSKSRYANWFDGLQKLRANARAGRTLPPHIGHTVEVLGATLAAKTIGDGIDDLVACSPAATAAVIAGSERTLPDAHRCLTDLARSYHGALPNLSPIVTFERVWIVAQLLRAGIALPPDLRPAVALLGRALARQGGLGMAPGFFLDCDITPTAVFIMRHCGFDANPETMSRFETATACATYYQGERNLSPTVNAHVLDALDACPAGPVEQRIHRKATTFLTDTQTDVGSWTDKWHASPYYAASCCAPALARHRDDAGAREAVERTRRWLSDTQRCDGGWGEWTGTIEETAYALQTLILTSAENADTMSDDQVVRVGTAYLRDRLVDSAGELTEPTFPPLWHGKELFTPQRIVKATMLATLHLAARHLRSGVGSGEALGRH